MIGETRDVVKPRYVAVKPLMDTKQPEEVCRRGVGGGASLALPESSVEVVAFADNSAFAGVKRLGNGFKVNEAAGKLEVRVGDGASGVICQDEETSDVVWPFNSPEYRDLSRPALSRLEAVAWEPNSTGALARGIVMALC